MDAGCHRLRAAVRVPSSSNGVAAHLQLEAPRAPLCSVADARPVSPRRSMTPGLAFFEAGLLRSRNSISVLMQCWAGLCILSMLWYAVGPQMRAAGWPLLR
jgi:hypothetical protein